MRMTIRYWCVAMLGAFLCACQMKPEPAQPGPLPVIPAPVTYEPGVGYFEVRAGTPVVPRGNDSVTIAVARHLAELVGRTRGLRLTVQPSTANGAIEFVLDPAFSAGSGDHGEGYDLRVTASGITLKANTAHGLFNGSITLWQLLTADFPAGPAIRVPAGHIVDYPRFAWRGLLLDSARHFQSPDFVKRFIDEMALHKLNVLHWHLTDDQGWRIEIKHYPKLTEIGAWRVPQPNETRLDEVDPETHRYGGYYTQDQIREIVRYAAERYVTIVPEIDMPGHAQAAIAAYPEIGVTGRAPPVSPDWGINTYLYNVDESTFAFVNNVLGEVLDLFPSPYIHVGGDEAAKDQWQASAHVQERMQRLGVRDEQALQGYFTARLDGFLRAHGRRLIGWDEILEGGLTPGAVVMSWRGVDGAIAAAKQDDDVIMAPDPVMYFDHLQATGHQQPPGRIKVISLADVYAFDPIPRELDAEQARHVLGAQANLWSEYLMTPALVEFAAFPRAAALAERLWSPPQRTTWNDFVARLPAQFDRYRALDINFSDSAFRPQVTSSPAPDPGKALVTLARQIDFGTIRYTTNGSQPDVSSSAYHGAFAMDERAMLRAATFAGARAVSAAVPWRVDGSMQRRRYSDRLKLCGDSLLLRLEGAALGEVPPRYDVDLMNPCWIYPQIDFDATATIDVRIGALPYFFELWHDTGKVVRRAPDGDADELQLRLDTCEGPLLAAIPLSNERTSVQTASVALREQAGTHDVCLFFAQRSRDPLRLIDWVEPIPRHN